MGSFLNVLALRHNTGLSVATGRSQCFSCGTTLSWRELIPVVSFLVLRGKCKTCAAPISWQYPCVEFLTGALFLATFIKIGFSQYILYYLCFIALLLVISVYDLKHKIIPDDFVYTFIALGFVMCLHMMLYAPDTHRFIDLLAGPILAIPFALLWLVSGGRWIGLGDAKLVLGMGFMLGLVHGISAVVLAFWIGAAWSIVMLVISRARHDAGRVTMKSEIPFGPFLVLATLLVFFFGWDVMGVAVLFAF